ncbi:MAG: hypothetical protein P8Z41_07375, partial [Anaerolineales bacterium]
FDPARSRPPLYRRPTPPERFKQLTMAQKELPAPDENDLDPHFPLERAAQDSTQSPDRPAAHYRKRQSGNRINSGMESAT